MDVSRKLPMGRWLNVSAAVGGNGAGFPDVRATVAPITLSPYHSRLLIAAGRSAAPALGADIPPLGDLVQQFRVEGAEVIANVEVAYAKGVVARMNLPSRAISEGVSPQAA